MSNLLINYIRRQPSVRRVSTISTASSSVVSSSEGCTFNRANESFDYEAPPIVDPPTKTESGSWILITLIIADSKNPAFVISDPTLNFNQKLFFILSQKWFWGLIVLFVLVISGPNVLMIFLFNKPTINIVVDRGGWDADPPDQGLKTLSLPVTRIILTHTRDKYESCNSTENCIVRVKNLQTKYMKEYGDIPYNFLVGDDGLVYEGRGFRHEGVIPDSNSSSFGEVGLIVAFIGTFYNRTPSEGMIRTFDTFISQQVKRDLIERKYKIFSEDQLTFSLSKLEGLVEAFEDRDEFYELLEVVGREEWEAVDENEEEKLKFLKPTNLLHLYSIPREYPCTTDKVECKDSLVRLQAQHKLELFLDIKYNFLIGELGVFEGRGWDVCPEPEQEYFSIGVFSDDLYAANKNLNSTLVRFIHDAYIIGKLRNIETTICDSVCSDAPDFIWV